jgi:hypothetical protein
VARIAGQIWGVWSWIPVTLVYWLMLAVLLAFGSHRNAFAPRAAPSSNQAKETLISEKKWGADVPRSGSPKPIAGPNINALLKL